MVPDSVLATELQKEIDSFRIEVNVPEFVLRLYVGDPTQGSVSRQSGQKPERLLATVGHETDWRTRIGTGHITNRYRYPVFRNLQTGKEYQYTRRDDGKTTLMVKIPTLEPEINGVCHGQLIHATTNPITLGKAASHGCIGTREGDAWRIYYHAPLGTRVDVVYRLEVADSTGR
jgi:hypothetical protein